MRRGRFVTTVAVLVAALFGGGWLVHRGLASPPATQELTAAQGRKLLTR